MNERNNHGQLRPPRPTLTRDILWIASVALVYFATARFSLLLQFQPEGIAAVWPPAGLFLSAILLTRRSLRPPLTTALFIADFIAEMLAGTPFLVSVIYALALTGDAVLSAWLLIRFVGEPIGFGKAREVIGFLGLAVILSNGLMSLAAAAVSMLIPGTSFWNSWTLWATSDGIGKLLVTPLILSWVSQAIAKWEDWTPKRALEGAALFILLALLNVLAFHYLRTSPLVSLFFPYVTFPFLLWAALRFGTPGVSVSMLIMAATAVSFAVAGPMANLPGTPLDHVIDIQLYLAIMAVPSLFLAAVVTERKRTEETLRENEERFRAIFEQAAVGVAQIETATGRFVLVNRRYCEIVGLTPEQMTAATYMAITHPEDLKADRDNVEQLRQGRIRNYSVEKRYRRPDGSLVWVNLTVSPMWVSGEIPTTHIAVVEDITGRRQVEETLLESRMLLQQVIDSSTSLIYLVDEEGRFILANNRLASLFGESPDRIHGKSREAFLPREIARHHRENDLQVLETGKTIVFEETNEEPDGPHTYYSVKFPVADSTGRIYAVGGISTDITDRKRAEAELRERNRYIETILENSPIGFAVNTIHDGKGVFVAGRFEDLYGVARGSITTVDEYFEKVYLDPVFREEIRARIMSDMASGDASRMRWENLPITTAAGENKFVTAINIPLIDQNLMVSTVQDVTAHHRAEEAIRRHTEELRARNEELTRFNRAATDRELRMIELKREVNDLCRKTGEPPRYSLDFAESKPKG